jgi:hypothetical protein
VFDASLVGHAPVFLARWKVISDAGKNMLVIDNCGILEEYRGRGLSKRSLGEIISLCVSATPRLCGVIFYLPSEGPLLSKISQLTDCRIEKYSELLDSGRPSWKNFICLWNPSTLAKSVQSI